VISLAIFLPLSLFIGFFGAFGSFPSFFFRPVTLITWLFWLLYFTYFESTTGQTLGKQVMKIRVVDETTMQHLDFGMSLVRNILRIIDWLPLFYLIGFLLIATNQKKQRIGDMVARSIVVRIYRQFMFQNVRYDKYRRVSVAHALISAFAYGEGTSRNIAALDLNTTPAFHEKISLCTNEARGQTN